MQSPSKSITKLCHKVGLSYRSAQRTMKYLKLHTTSTQSTKQSEKVYITVSDFDSSFEIVSSSWIIITLWMKHCFTKVVMLTQSIDNLYEFHEVALHMLHLFCAVSCCVWLIPFPLDTLYMLNVTRNWLYRSWNRTWLLVTAVWCDRTYSKPHSRMMEEFFGDTLFWRMYDQHDLHEQ